MPDQLLTPKQVADLLQLGLRTVYRYAADGQLPSRKIGGSLRFHRADLSALLDA